ncbi:dicarboxylate/amino acid:cation symporter [Alteriqipengyuania lutimaris]|uniref:Dicarboxylate/amino acid:cation symporter n=1 Tax=Alteriqipengyuania lutimaris TaxID=1538146 RepID=A0A395LGJ7_9SPHN|nr:dicarboxylate/amino acid:cation symporter [Alteriqipengyuania lutimaris]MBB3035432.1 Na+/H+-dicarboxylate symporter [Alteriqipengyuania lutimaris]RDS76006.1 dicarboxylate/amino acid:cation symporter [Alteriqipengyuania lutimaris]
MTWLRRWQALALWRRVVVGLIAGIALGLLAPSASAYIAFLGDLFVRLIRMLVVPIVFISLASGVTALADPRRLGAVGARTIALFAATTFCAVAIGMAAGLVIQPGLGAAIGNGEAFALGEPVPVYDQLMGIVPINVVEALVAGDMLAIIFFAIAFGVATVLAGEEGYPVANLLQSAARILFRLVALVMEFTPYGVFALIAVAVAQNGIAVFTNIGWLALCVAIGVGVQIALIHVPLLIFVARRQIGAFYRAAIDALAVAFATASSAATLPVALRVAIEKMQIDRGVASTVLPIGASIGKDGTAMYVGLLSVFSLQALGVTPDLAMLSIVLLTGALAAFGTAPIPSASLFMLAAVLASVGVSTAQTALIIGFVLPFDRLLDMTRTVASASANLTVTASVDKWERRDDLVQ